MMIEIPRVGFEFVVKTTLLLTRYLLILAFTSQPACRYQYPGDQIVSSSMSTFLKF